MILYDIHCECLESVSISEVTWFKVVEKLRSAWGGKSDQYILKSFKLTGILQNKTY